MEKYIVLSARTTSEWDGVDYALLPYSEEFFKKLLSIKTKLEELEKDGIADRLTLYADDVDFFSNEEDLDEMSQPVNEDTPLLIELTEEQYQALSRPQQDFRYGERAYNHDGVTFIGHGKHTDEEYWCRISWEYIEQFAALQQAH